MTEGDMEVGYTISTHASRMSKDAAVLTEHQVNTGRTPWLLRRNIRIHTELGRTKERRDKKEGGKGAEQMRPGCTWGWGSWSTGERSLLHGRPVGRESHLKQLGSELTNLWQPKWSENHIDKPCCSLSYLGQGCKSLVSTETGNWTHGDCRIIPGWGCLLTMGSQLNGMGWPKSA